jgi:hypothetical protein
MAAIEKIYALPPEVLLNAIYDVQEIRKAKITHSHHEAGEVSEVEMVAEMYKIKTSYTFRLTRTAAGTALTIKSEGKSYSARQSIHFMLTVLDGMVDQFVSCSGDGKYAE